MAGLVLELGGDEGYLVVACADKLHNARAILQGFRAGGPAVWKRFTGSGDKAPGIIVGYYDARAEKMPGSMASELRSTVDRLVSESGKTPDRGWEKPG